MPVHALLQYRTHPYADLRSPKYSDEPNHEPICESTKYPLCPHLPRLQRRGVGPGTAEDAGIDLGPRWTLSGRTLCEESYGPIETGAWVRETSLTEISGMVASPSREHVLWMHNDAGDEARLYAVGIDGADRGRITLPIDAVDWEDIAAAPCPDGSGPCIWVGDIGDNDANRDSVSVYAVPEPHIDGRIVANEFWHFPFRYPNGPRDAEALVVSPEGRTLWIFEKMMMAECVRFNLRGL